jgi:CRISPR-associated protein (TIGR02710 family)
MTTFEENVARLERIFRGGENYGSGTQTQQAHQFRIDVMLEGIIEKARKKSDAKSGIDLLISLSGFSPSTTIIAYEIIAPKKLLVLSSESTEDSINTIGDYLIGSGRLKLSDFMVLYCKPSDPLSIYELISEEITRIRPMSGDEIEAIIDITGGKKVMSATAAQAAWQLDLPLCYIDSRFNDEMRIPVPGTERLILISNPAELYGDVEMNAAKDMFNDGRFESAHNQYLKLSQRISKPASARFMASLSSLYKAWCDVDLKSLPGAIETVENDLQDTRVTNLMGSKNKTTIAHQINFLKELLKENRRIIQLNFWVLGLHYQGLGRHDFAALFFYRTIEGCLAARLETEYNGFVCKKPDYSVLPYSYSDLLNNFLTATRSMGLKYDNTDLPHFSLGYMNSAFLLEAMEDSLLTRVKSHGNKNPLKLLYELSKIRNESILAHGLQSVSEKNCQKIQYAAFNILDAFNNLAEGKADLKKECESLRFIKL